MLEWDVLRTRGGSGTAAKQLQAEILKACEAGTGGI